MCVFESSCTVISFMYCDFIGRLFVFDKHFIETIVDTRQWRALGYSIDNATSYELLFDFYAHLDWWHKIYLLNSQLIFSFPIEVWPLAFKVLMWNLWFQHADQVQNASQ